MATILGIRHLNNRQGNQRVRYNSGGGRYCDEMKIWPGEDAEIDGTFLIGKILEQYSVKNCFCRHKQKTLHVPSEVNDCLALIREKLM